MLEYQAKLLAFRVFLKKMVCLTKLPSASHWSHLIQKRWKLLSTLCGNHLVVATTTENCFTIWHCWAHVRWAFSSTCGVCTYRFEVSLASAAPSDVRSLTFFASRFCLLVSFASSISFGVREAQEIVYDGGFKNHYSNTIWEYLESLTYLFCFCQAY